MSVETSLIGWIVGRYHDIIERICAETPLVADRGAPVSESEFLEVFRKASAMPADTEEERAAKRDALESVLPCEEESYASCCEADDVRSLLEEVLPREKVEGSEELSQILSDMTALVKGFYFLTEGTGPSWWYR